MTLDIFGASSCQKIDICGLALLVLLKLSKNRNFQFWASIEKSFWRRAPYDLASMIWHRASINFKEAFEAALPSSEPARWQLIQDHRCPRPQLASLSTRLLLRERRFTDTKPHGPSTVWTGEAWVLYWAHRYNFLYPSKIESTFTQCRPWPYLRFYPTVFYLNT